MSDTFLLDDRDEFWTPTMMWASPGIGKSLLLRKLAPNAVFINMSVALDPADLMGLPQSTTQKESNNAR